MLNDIKISDFFKNLSKYDLIIDSRSPKEFSHSKIPNAVNFFALSDEEHHEIGTIYKNESSSKAKVLGASYICKNVSSHLQEIYKNYPLGSKIAIYCARGGLRSASMAIILSHTGYLVERIEQGYKAYRRYVLEYLERFEHKNFIVLCGNTGCGKSELLANLDTSIKTETLANHFGSTFGSIKGVQPSQKEFQNLLAYALFNIDPKEWIYVEAESKKIGSIIQPELFFNRTHNGFKVLISAPLELRIQRIMRDYQAVDAAFFYASMNHIKPYIQRKFFDAALESFDKNELEKVAEILLLEYYDKVYRQPNEVHRHLHVKDISSAVNELKELKKELSKENNKF
jgi:tRNA 2-selenouridine synthase